MKFKAGDRVRVKEGLISNKSYDGIRFAPEMQEYCGKKYIVESFVTGNRVWRLEGIEHWVFSDEMLELAPFGKSDLKTGWRALMRDEDDYVVMKDTDCEDRLFSIDDKYGTEPLSNYNEDLTNKISSACDIDAIYKPKYTYVMFGNLNRLDFELVWKREEEPIEVTIAEIAELKGVSPERIRIKED